MSYFIPAPRVPFAFFRTRALIKHFLGSKRLVMLSLALVLACLCVGCDSHKPAAAETMTADGLLRDFSRRLNAELINRDGDVSQNELITKSSSLAAEMLLPHKALFEQKVKDDLKNLPRLEGNISADYATLHEVPAGKLAEELVKASIGAESAPSSESLSIKGMTFLITWHPIGELYPIRIQTWSHVLGMEKVRQRLMIEAYARPAVYAIDPAPAHPVLAFETGPELFIVTFKRTDEGGYVDEKIQWLRKRTSQEGQK